MKTFIKPAGMLTLMALALAPAGSTYAGDTRLSLETLGNDLHTDLGSGNSVYFTRPQPQTGSTLVTRPHDAVLCSSTTGHAAALPGVTVDPNGYIPPFNIGARSVTEELLQLQSFPENAQFRTADRFAFSDMLFPVEPNFVVVGDVNAHCVSGLVEPTPPPGSGCEVQPDSYNADRIARLGFDGEGYLQLQSRIVDITPSGIYYEHVVHASGGPVTGVQLREQFPYHSSTPGQARFKDSLNIDSAWVCRASTGGQCSPSGINDAGLGFAHLNDASLDAGACLRIVAMRPIAREGALADDFSGSVHAALFHQHHDGNGSVQMGISQTRLNFD